MIYALGSSVESRAGEPALPTMSKDQTLCAALLAAAAREVVALDKIFSPRFRMLDASKVGVPGRGQGYALKFGSNNYGPVEVLVEFEGDATGGRLYLSFLDPDFRHSLIRNVDPFKSLPFEVDGSRFGPLLGSQLNDPSSPEARAFRILFQ
jgi:hypothetical protein